VSAVVLAEAWPDIEAATSPESATTETVEP
jgi:hypothetical protein